MKGMTKSNEKKGDEDEEEKKVRKEKLRSEEEKRKKYRKEGGKDEEGQIFSTCRFIYINIFVGWLPLGNRRLTT